MSISTDQISSTERERGAGNKQSRYRYNAVKCPNDNTFAFAFVISDAKIAVSYYHVYPQLISVMQLLPAGHLMLVVVLTNALVLI